MSGITPNFDDWRKLSSIEICEIAVLMNRFDPRALTDVVVRNPSDPKDPYGVPLDASWEERSLISAVLTGDLLSTPANTISPNRHTMITVASLVPWLVSAGYDELASELKPAEGMTLGKFEGQILREPIPASSHSLP